MLLKFLRPCLHRLIGQILTIVILLNINACGCGSKPATKKEKPNSKTSQNEHAKSSNSNSVFYEGLALQVDKPILKGADKEFKVYITATKLNINIAQSSDNQEVLSKKFKLKASIVQPDNASTKGSRLSYKNSIGQLEEREQLISYLTFAEIAHLNPNSALSTITFQIQPHPNVTKLSILLELFDEKEEEKAKVTQTVTWESTPSKIYFEGLKDIQNNDILEFSIRNDSEDLILSGVTLNLLITGGTSFTLDGKLIGLSLQDLLVSGKATWVQGESSRKIQLKLDNENGQHRAEITLMLTQANNQILASEKIKWCKQVIPVTPLTFVGLKDIHDQEKLVFYIENQDDRKINTNDVWLSISATNGVTFTINGKSEKRAVLSHFLDSVSEIYKGHIPSSLMLQVQDVREQKESDLMLTLTQPNGQEIQKTIKWYAKEIQLSFEGLGSNLILNGNQTLNFKINNNRDPIDLDEAKLFVNTTNGTSVILNNTPISATGMSLRQLTQVNSSVLGKGEHLNLTLQVQNDYPVKNSTLIVQLKYDNQFWDSSAIIWKEKESKLSFQNFPEKKLLYVKNDFSFQIKNDGDIVHRGEYYIQVIFDRKVFKELRLNEISIQPSTDEQHELIDLLDLVTFDTNNVAVIHGKVNKNNILPSSEDKRFIIFKLYQVENRKSQERLLIQEEKVVWRCPIPKLAFTIYDNHSKEVVLEGNKRDFKLQVTNIGDFDFSDANIYDLFLYCERKQGKSEIYKLGTELPVIENDQSTSITYLAGNIFEIEHIKTNKYILLPLTIVPIISDPSSYEFQLGFIDQNKKKYLLPERINVMWQPKIVPLQLKTSISKLAKGNSEIKLSLLKIKDDLKWLAIPGTEDKVYLRIERKRGKHAEIYLKDEIDKKHRTLLKKNQHVFLQPIAGLEKIPLNEEYEFPTLHIHSHRDKQEEFDFSLFYVYIYRSKVPLESLISGPATVAWEPPIKKKSKKNF